ncbi:MAG: prolyl oligopeptidase family serine peptidase [Actinomycetota bacterium]|nr:prolyl oligopeptidase family serine peptidase [Actinomycetota bacterium]MDQ2955803.1 prolyl oligopeptidase family serine peptidase [Actinomycetota bacterium]
MQTAPYGSWTSPISAADLAASGHPVSGGRFVAGDQVWWSELRPSEAGRTAIRRQLPGGPVEDVLAAPWNARTRVHEYGGSSWLATGEGVVVFAEFTDQRLYRLDPGAEPVPISPAAENPSSLRYADPTLSKAGDEIWCIRESHDADGVITRDLCAVPLEGSAAENPTAIRSIVGGSNFLAHARVSPDGRRLAWIAWNHPQMPWDGTELRIADLDAEGRCGSWRTVLGSSTESVMQPEWLDNESLYAISDRTGWWNLYRISLAERPTGGDPSEHRPRNEAGAERADNICPFEADFAGPMWLLGMRWYAILADGRLLTVRTLGESRLAILDPATGELTDFDLGDLGTLALGGVADGRVLLGSAGSRTAAGIRLLDLTSGELTDVRLSVDSLPDPAYLPEAELMTLPGPGGREVHTLVYRPRNPDFAAPAGELPPYVAFVHGGPTVHVSPTVDLAVGYLTSRGIGVVDVNYGGSTGYGRAYRERLRGQWGVVDVEDTVAAVQGLVRAGLADGDRLAIEGGSSGGWTVLAALTGTSVFACGASYFGVAELVEFSKHTHDFESRYLDGLVGPLPEALALWHERAPLNNIDGLSCPVLLLQGLDDPIVPPFQSEMFRDALVANSIPHAYLAYEGESHGFRRAESQIHSREAELSFYGQVLGFEPPGIPRLELWRPAD